MEESSQGVDAPRHRPATGVTFSRPMIVGLLYLLNIVFGFSVIVGVVLAYVWRNDGDSQSWENTHFTYLIRTFWIGFVLFVGSTVMFFGTFFAVFPGEAGSGDPPSTAFFVNFFGILFAWLLMAAWFCVRCVLSMTRAGSNKPMPNPETWLF